MTLMRKLMGHTAVSASQAPINLATTLLKFCLGHEPFVLAFAGWIILVSTLVVPLLLKLRLNTRIKVMTCSETFEPRREKTCHRGFLPGPTQTELYSHRKRLEA